MKISKIYYFCFSSHNFGYFKINFAGSKHLVVIHVWEKIIQMQLLHWSKSPLAGIAPGRNPPALPHRYNYCFGICVVRYLRQIINYTIFDNHPCSTPISFFHFNKNFCGIPSRKRTTLGRCRRSYFALRRLRRWYIGITTT